MIDIVLHFSRLTDTQNILACLKHPEIYNNVSIVPQKNQENFVVDWIKYSDVKGNYTVRNHSEFIGCAGLHPKENKTAEIGYFILPKFHGQGLGTQIVRLLIDKAQEQNITKLYATSALDNVASVKVLQKNGFVILDKITIVTADNKSRESYQLILELA